MGQKQFVQGQSKLNRVSDVKLAISGVRAHAETIAIRIAGQRIIQFNAMTSADLDAAGPCGLPGGACPSQ